MSSQTVLSGVTSLFPIPTPDFTPILNLAHAHEAQASILTGVFSILSELPTVSVAALRVQHVRPPFGVPTSIWNNVLDDCIELLERLGVVTLTVRVPTVSRGLSFEMARALLSDRLGLIERAHLLERLHAS